MNASELSDIIEWDKYNWGRAVSFWDDHARLEVGRGSCSVLDVGARGGGLSLYWALLGANVVCTDIGDDFSQAQYLHQRYQVTDRISYDTLDATSIDFPYHQQFDVVTFKSVLGSAGRFDNFDNQVAMMDNLYGALKPGGALYFCENLVASRAHMAARKAFVKHAQHWRYVTVNEILALTEMYESVEWKTFGFFGVFGRSALTSYAFSMLDSRADRFIPPNSRYIVSCICRKSL